MKKLLLSFLRSIDIHAFRLLIAWLVILTVLYATLSVIRHNNYQTGGFDLGLYDQEVWQYSRFLSPYNTVKERFILGDHLNLTTPLLGPLFWIWDDVRALLLFQVLWIMVSVVAVYHLMKLRKFSSSVALCISVTYSLFYGIQYMLFFDFHAVAIGVGLLPWFIYFLETNRKKLFVATLIFLILTQENMGLALVSLGLYYVWKKQYRARAALFIVGGMTISLLAGWLITRLSPAGFQYAPHVSINPITNIIGLFDAPDKRQVWLYSLLSFGFLPILSPGAMLAFVFDLAQYFVTGVDLARTWSPFMHHRAILAIYLTLGTLDVLALLKRRRVNVAMISVSLLLITVVLQYALHLPLNKLAKKDYWRRESWMYDVDAFLKTIPKDMRIVTQQSLIPHLSHRQHIYLFWPRKHDFDSKPCGRTSCWWLDFNQTPDFLLVDMHPHQWITQLLETNENVEEALTVMQKEGILRPVRSRGDVRLYRIVKQ